jgi:hypothetical protein
MNKAGKIKKLLITSMSVKEIAEQVKCTPDYVYQLRLKWNKDKQVVKRKPMTETSQKEIDKEPKYAPTANNVQVGGTHYKTQDIQPWDAIRSWNLCFFAGNAVKYIARHKSKGGVEDLRKARHYLDKLIELQVK